MRTSSRPFLRQSLSRVAVAGVATIASVVAVAPVAVADDEVASDSESSSSETPAPEVETPAEPDPQAEEPTPEPEPAPEQEVPAEPAPEVETSSTVGAEEGAAPQRVAALADEDPVFVDRAVRVRVGFDGTPQPAASSAGTLITIVITAADDSQTFVYCETTPVPDDDRFSECLFDEGSRDLQAPAGSTVTANVTSTNEGQPLVSERSLSAAPVTEGDPQTLDFLVQAPGPQAKNDSKETAQAEPILIDVAENDLYDTADPTISLDESSPPAHGTVELVDREGGVGTQLIRYTPDEDFVGTDAFGYSLGDGEYSSSATVSVDVKAAEDVEPNYGTRKYRVAVDIDPDAYVPAGTTTVGSTFTIETTAADGTVSTATCTTVPAFFLGPIPGATSTGSSCPGDNDIPVSFYDFYYAPAGATVKISQATAPENLLPSEVVRTIEPCEVGSPECGTSTTTADFLDKGSVLPDAVDDSATTDAGRATTVDVLANDTSDDPEPAELSIDDDPEHGTATVVGSPGAAVDPGPGLPPVLPMGRMATRAAVANEGTLAVRYTPAAGFSGVDTFTYAVSNSNGPSTATVTVTVRDGEVADSSDDDADVADDTAASSPSAPRSASSLPNTGGPGGGWLGLGALLVAAGGAVTAWARRRNEATPVD